MSLTTVERRPLIRLARVGRPEWPRVAAAALLGALAIGCAVALLATSAWLISQASLQPPILTLEVAFVAVRAFGLGRGAFRYSERLVGHDAAFRSLSRLRVQVYERLARVGPAGVASFRRGDLLTRLVDDVDASQNLPLRVVIPSVSAVLVGLGSVVLAFVLLPAAGVILALALLVAGLVVPWLGAVAGREEEKRSAAARGELSNHIVDLLVGSGDLMAFGVADRAVDRARGTDAELTRLSNRSSLIVGVASGLGVLCVGAAVVASLLVAIPAVLDGRLPGVCLAVIALLPLAAAESVVALPAAALSLAAVRASGVRVTEVLDAPSLLPDTTTPVPLPDGDRHVRLRDVSARWSPQAEWAVHSIDLDLPAGRRVAVIGASGAGKSTLAAVLLRFIDHEGSVTIDGVEVRDLEDDDLRHTVTAMGQDAHVFDTTVAENLRLARRGATDDALSAVLERVGLGAWLASLAAGLNTPLGAHGTGLSGGEAQRLALARVLLSDCPVVVLDEPAEHLDPATADALTADLLALTEGRSTVFITHRLVGLEVVDEIVVLDHGVIVERGSHLELLALGGRYTRWMSLSSGSTDG